MKLSFLGGRFRVHILLFPVVLIMCIITGVSNVLAYMLALFLHECGHLAAARALGLSVRAMEVYPFGCAARMEGWGPVGGGKELAVAAAGPAVNLILGAGALLSSWALSDPDFSRRFLWANILLAAMNLLPVLPMDGGRMLRVILGLVLPPLRATRIAAGLGAGAALGMLALGVWVWVRAGLNPTLFLMGGFMLYGSFDAFRSAPFAAMQHAAAKNRQLVQRASLSVQNLAVHQSRRAGEVLGALNDRKYNVIYVLDDDLRIQGRLDEGKLMEGLLKKGTDVPVGRL